MPGRGASVRGRALRGGGGTEDDDVRSDGVQGGPGIANVRRGRLARTYAIGRVPTFVFWSDGRELARMEGTLAPAAVRAQLEFLSGMEVGHVGSLHTH
jgi:hypothetical protein